MNNYSNIFEIKEIPKEVEEIQHTRRSRQWEYKFKSLNLGIKLTVDDKTTAINNLDSEVQRIMNELNKLDDSNRRAFFYELTEIYVASQLPAGNEKDLEILDMHFDRLKRDQEYNKKRNEIISKIQSEDTKININKMIKGISDKYMGVDRNSNMELDNLFPTYGLFDKISSLNRFMNRYPDDELTFLSKAYMGVMEKKYLLLLNNPLGIITSKNFNEENLELTWPLSSISKCFYNKYVAEINADPDGSIYNSTIADIKNRITTQYNDFYADKDEQIEIIKNLLYGKFNALNREVLDKKSKYQLDDIPDIKQFQNGINAELHKLKNTNDPIEFYNKVKAFEKVCASIDEVAHSIQSIQEYEIQNLNKTLLDPTDESLEKIKYSFEKLENTLKSNGIYNDEIKGFFEKIFEWFASLFNEKMIEIKDPGKEFTPMTCGAEALKEQRGSFYQRPPISQTF